MLKAHSFVVLINLIISLTKRATSLKTLSIPPQARFLPGLLRDIFLGGFSDGGRS